MKPAKKNTSSTPDEEIPPAEMFMGIVQHLVHPDITLCSDFSFNLLRVDARKDENQHKNVELSKFWLPPNGVYDQSQKLINRHDFVAAIVLAAEKQIRRAKRSKTRNARVVFLVATLSKLFEYVWLKDRFSTTAILPQDFDELARVLAHGGWHEALRVEERMTKALPSR